MKTPTISAGGTLGPFHAGELEAQARAGGGNPGGGIRAAMSGHQRAFFEALPFVGVAALEDGWPEATLLSGAPGFIEAVDARTLVVHAALDPGDPAARAIAPGAEVGVLGLDPSTQRRNRANGVVLAASPAGFALEVRQAFGNCPKYIHPRDFAPAAHARAPAEAFDGLDAEAAAAIARADTFLVASAARSGERNGGADLSHRGGPAGFVRVEAGTLLVPDYSGNRYFDTLGNFVSWPRAGLLFADFESGDLLHVDGEVEIDWDGAGAGGSVLPGAERVWRVRVRRGVRRRGAFPFRAVA